MRYSIKAYNRSLRPPFTTFSGRDISGVLPLKRATIVIMNIKNGMTDSIRKKADLPERAEILLDLLLRRKYFI